MSAEVDQGIDDIDPTIPNHGIFLQESLMNFRDALLKRSIRHDERNIPLNPLDEIILDTFDLTSGQPPSSFISLGHYKSPGEALRCLRPFLPMYLDLVSSHTLVDKRDGRILPHTIKDDNEKNDLCKQSSPRLTGLRKHVCGEPAVTIIATSLQLPVREVGQC